MEQTDQQASLAQRLREVALLFLRIGSTGFGGPAVTIAMMEDEVVGRRGWLSRDYFLDLVGSTNLIPGPNAAEMAIHIGYLRAGWMGLITAGVCFIVPAALLTTALAWAYVRYGALPQVAPFLYGAKPAVLAVIVSALWRLGKTAAKGWQLLLIGLAATLASLLGANEILALFSCGLLGMTWLCLAGGADPSQRSGKANAALWLAPGTLFGGGRAVAGAVLAASAAGAAAVSLWELGLFFLKIGAVLYGSGYVLVAFLEGGLVHGHGWLSQPQLLDAIAAGQFTPGPLFSTAAFVGYLLRGLPGAAVATTGIFLPSFAFVAVLSPFVPRLRRSRWTAAFLDAINISSLGLMGAVTLKLAQTTLRAWPAWVIALLAAGAGLRWKVNSTWLVLGGAALGWGLSRVV